MYWTIKRRIHYTPWYVKAAIIMFISLLFVYAGATVFDMILGTTARPIILLATTAGMIAGQSEVLGPKDTRTLGDKIMHKLMSWGFMLVFSPCIAVVMMVLFPDTVQTFLSMVSYEGSFFMLALLGTFFGGAIANVLFICNVTVGTVFFD